MIFTYEMFACPCCGENHIWGEVVEGMNRALILLNNALETITEVKITSGYRCPLHNADVGGARHSLHMRGLAVDSVPVLSQGASSTELNHALRHWTFALIKAGFTGIGQTHPNREDGIAIHADLRHMIGKSPQIWAPPGNLKDYEGYTYYFKW